MRNKLILLIAILFGAMASLGAFRYLQHVEATYQLSGNYAQVARANQNIPARATIQSSMLEFVEVPVEYVMSGAVLEAGEAVGKLARGDIYEGEQLIDRKLMERQDQQGGLAVKVDEGKRAVAIPVSKVSSLHELLEVNDRVDVMVTFGYKLEKTDSASGRREETDHVATSTIIQDTPILAINGHTVPGDSGAEETSIVTVMVDPHDAQLIALGTQQGSIQLTLRSPEDESIIVIPMVEVEDFIR